MSNIVITLFGKRALVLLYFSLVCTCSVFTVCHSLFTLNLSVIGRPSSVIGAFP